MRSLLGITLGSLFAYSMPASAHMESLGNKDTIAAARLSDNELRDIISAVKESAYDVPKSWRTELRFRRVDLGHDPGLAVQGTSLLCGATGNCQIWLFRKANAHWVPVFGKTETIIAEGFELGPTLTRGIKDLTIVANFGADETKRTKYRFDGRSYRIR